VAFDNFFVSNQGSNPLAGFNFIVRVELITDVPCKSVRAFARELEYDLIQEGGLNDYVHMRRKPITKPFTLEIERYCGVDFFDPFPLGADLALPLLLLVNRTAGPLAVPGRTYIFTGCTVMKKTYGELNGAQSGLLTDTITLAYRELLVVTTPMLGAISEAIAGQTNYSGTWSSKHGDDYKAKYDDFKTAKEARDAEEAGWKELGGKFSGEAKDKAAAEKAAREKAQKEREAAAQAQAKAQKAEQDKKDKEFLKEEERKKKEEEARKEAGTNERFADEAKLAAETHKKTEAVEAKAREAASKNMTDFKDKMSKQADEFKKANEEIEEARQKKEAEIAEKIKDEQEAADAYMEALKEFEAARDALEEENKAAMDKITEDYNKEAAKIESDRAAALDEVKKETEEKREEIAEKYSKKEDDPGEENEKPDEADEEPSGGITDADAP